MHIHNQRQAMLLGIAAVILWSTVANLIFLSPFPSLLLVHYILGEAILPATAIGLVLIILAVGLQQRQQVPVDSRAVT